MKAKTKQFDAIRVKRNAQASVRADLKGKSIADELAYYAAANERWRNRARLERGSKREK